MLRNLARLNPEVYFLHISLCDKWHFNVRMFRKYVACGNAFAIYLGDESIGRNMCVHVHFPSNVNGDTLVGNYREVSRLFFM